MSQLFAPADHSPELLARLHLQAVLPAFPELMKHSEAACQLMLKQRFRLRFSCRDLSAELCFNRGRCRYRSHPRARPSIHLRYLTYPQLNRGFSGNACSLPIPRLSPFHIPKLLTFSKLSAQLKAILESTRELSTAQKLLHFRLALRIALAAATVLIDHEAFSNSLLGEAQDWAVRFRLEDTDLDLWIGRRKGCLTWRENFSAPAVAELHFSSIDMAHRSLQGTLDNMAAMNEGGLRLKGYLPVAERLSLVLERVPLYLQTSQPVS